METPEERKAKERTGDSREEGKHNKLSEDKISQGKAEGEINKTNQWNKKDKSLCTRHRKNPWNKCARSRLLSRTQGRLDVWSWVLALKPPAVRFLHPAKFAHNICTHHDCSAHGAVYYAFNTLIFSLSLSLSLYIYDAYISGWLYNHHWHSAGAFSWVIL